MRVVSKVIMHEPRAIGGGSLFLFILQLKEEVDRLQSRKRKRQELKTKNPINTTCGATIRGVTSLVSRYSPLRASEGKKRKKKNV